MFPKQPGTYCFKNTVTNKIYIGSAKCLYTRINNHLKAKNSNQHLQNAIRHYGIDLFCITYQVLETKEQALCLEQMLLDYIFKLNIDCYNIHDKASGGYVCTKENHKKLCEAAGGHKAKVRYALEVNNATLLYTFQSSVEASNFTKVPRSAVLKACKNAKPYNSESGRWLFSDISINDLKVKFNNLTQTIIKGNCNRPFILINKITNKQSQIFYTAREPQKYGYKINQGNLSSCILGNLKTVNGYYVALCI